jgi:hypothetical protein
MARRALQFGHLQTTTWPEAEVALGLGSGFNPGLGPIYVRQGPAPKGLEDSAQGFNPGNLQKKRFALKGREM